MRLAALSAGSGILLATFGSEPVRALAHVQFAHAMATVACATVMNIGGHAARRAPAFFLGGSLVFCGTGYALAAGAPAWTGALRWPGAALLICGWAVLAWAAGRVDGQARAVGLAGASARAQRRRGLVHEERELQV